MLPVVSAACGNAGRADSSSGGASTRGEIEVPGARLVYHAVGAGPDMLVLHGGPGFGSRYLERPLTEALSTERRLLFLDQRGSGESDGQENPDDLRLEVWLADIEAALDEMATGPVDVLGHSFGGLLALHLALRSPGRIRSLVLVEPDPLRFDEWTRFRDVLAERGRPDEDREIERIRSAPGWERDAEAADAYLRAYLRPYFGSPEAIDDVDFGATPALLEKISTTGAALRSDLGEWDLEAAAAEIDIPTLVIYGERSIFPVSAGERYARTIPGARLAVAPEAGHFPFVETPAWFRTTVSAFLSSPGPTELVRKLGQAFNAHDVDAMVALADPEIEWLSAVGSELVVETRGAGALEAAMRDYFAANPTAHTDITILESNGPYVAILERAEAESGRSQTSVAVYEVRGGKIRRAWYYPAVAGG